MRVTLAIDRFLDQMAVERDWTARSIASYRSVLEVIVDELGEEVTLEDLDGRAGTEKLRRIIARRWATTSAGRRANVISIFHSFFGWAEDEELVQDDPARRIRRPPRRRADVYRPGPAELLLGYRACTLYERAPWLLAGGIGLRASTVVAVRWRHLDLARGRVNVIVKGGHRDVLPIAPDVLAELQDVYAQLAPDPDDHVFTVQRELEHGNRGRARKTRDPKKPASTKSFWLMVRRVTKRAGLRPFGPHALRHGFATNFLRDSDRDVASLRRLMVHSQLETTMGYTDELELEELEDALRRVSDRRAEAGTSVAWSGNFDQGEAELLLNPADGPGRNRTSGPGRPADSPGEDRADEADEPPVTDRKGGHK